MARKKFSSRFLLTVTPKRKKRMLSTTTIPTTSSSLLFAKTLRRPTTRNYKVTRNQHAVVVKVMASSAGDGGPNEVFSANSSSLRFLFCLRVCCFESKLARSVSFVVVVVVIASSVFWRKRGDPGARSFSFSSRFSRIPSPARALTNDVPLR